MFEQQKIIGETFNLGTGYEISVKEIVNLVSKITNKKLAIKTDSSRMRPKKSEVDRLVADNSKSKKLLNWSPKYSGKEGFKKGLIKTIDWFENNLSKINYKPHIYNL